MSLATRASYNNSISGIVRDSAAKILWSRLDFYKVEQGGGTTRFQLARSITSDSSNGGNFQVSDLIPGNYVVFARDLSYWDSSYVPGYYKESDYAVPSWEDATQIVVGSSSTITGIDIKLHYANGAHGSALLRGTIDQKGGRAQKGNGNSTQSTTPAVGVMVVAIDANDQIANYTFTDANGQFTLTRLGKGTYRIIGDKIGLRSYRATETFSFDGEERQTEGSMQNSGTSSVTAPVAIGSGGASLYPNPASGRVTVGFQSTAGAVHVTVADALGRQVYATDLQADGGLARFDLDASRLQSGVYMVRIAGQSVSATLPLRIVR
jgi:hypothetical protein